MLNYKVMFEASFARVSSQELDQEFFATFYSRFLLTDKNVAAMFAKTDMNHQFGMLRDSLDELRAFSTTLKRTDYLDKLARGHGARGLKIGASFYDSWLNALIDTVHEMDPEADEQVEVAWRVTLAPGISFMKFYAASS